ncbi:hypothetical protein HMPREF0981_02339 [Erysipelotrichaceae bacterium 6_1_45]|uniref:hypothetical protein n=1 Tax=Clostridium innocuum TaxID=1522 RepID=UPI000246D774|nr:hypothetical protein [[Clostridium] innocuum]EHO26993.1 hypothetical protein HMPREF0981_02339 [Erysipelotrichaceae bacterium 6_1_45]
MSEMVDSTLKKELIAHNIYSAWQFIEYTEKNIATVQYCSDTIKNIIDKMTTKTVRWQQNISSDFVDEVTEDGKNVKHLSVTTENAPTYEVRVAGEKIDPWFLFDKLLRDFFQYTMNTFDSMSQIINAGILANKGKKVDSVDIQIMVRCFNQQTYSAAFPKMQSWLNKISQSTEFKYIEAINNRTKHTGDIANKLSMGILGSSNRAEIGPFFRKDIQHGKNELSDQLLATLDFLNDSWDEFQNVFKEEFVRDVYVQNRRHGISGVRQQKLKNEPDKDLSYAYIEVNGSFDTMPDELYILLVTEREDDMYAHECPFNTILVTGSSNIDVLGRYKAEDVIGDDCLLHYRKYRKDTEIIGGICMFYEQQEKTVFYHANPYFNVESISDDNEFLTRTSMPF